MGWNGADLVNDFSAELGDVNTPFKTKVLRWINEGIKDIASSYEWSFLREKGEAILQGGEHTHSIVMSQPSAPTIAASAGGSLTADVDYSILVTFYDGYAEVESIRGAESNIATPTGSDLTLTVSDIPVSTSSLVTERRVYVSKDGGPFYYRTSLGNNAQTTMTISTDLETVITSPEEDYIRVIDGDFCLPNNQVIREYSLQRLIFETGGTLSLGTPQVWAPINEKEIRVYPAPNDSTSFTNETVLDDEDMSSSFASDAILVSGAADFSLQVVFEGAPVGTFKLQASNDTTDEASEVTNWSDIADSSEAITEEGSILYDVTNIFRWVRIVYTFTSGTGSCTALSLIPTENSNLVTFYYFKIPAQVFNLSTSIPQIPSWLYDDLRNYVLWRGYSYRDRAGQESKKLNYDMGLKQTISRKGKPNKGSGRIRSVTPDSDGFVP